MSAVPIVLLAVATVALVPVVYVSFLSAEARAKQTLARRTRARIGEAADGTLRVTGRVRRRGELLKAPVSGRPCVAYQLLVEQYDRGWRELAGLRDARPFVIMDETGEALVDTTGGPFLLALDSDERGGTGLFDKIGEAQLQAIRSLCQLESPGRTGRERRYREGILREGETVAVGGRGVREMSAEGTRANLREPPQWLVLRGTVEEPLLISDSLDAIDPTASRLPRR